MDCYVEIKYTITLYIILWILANIFCNNFSITTSQYIINIVKLWKHFTFYSVSLFDLRLPITFWHLQIFLGFELLVGRGVKYINMVKVLYSKTELSNRLLKNFRPGHFSFYYVLKFSLWITSRYLLIFLKTNSFEIRFKQKKSPMELSGSVSVYNRNILSIYGKNYYLWHMYAI